MPSNHLILCRPLLLLSSIFLSIRVFSSESVLCIRWPKYWSFSFSLSPCNEYSELISFSWISLQSKGLKSLLQHHSSKPSILRHSAFFIVQLSYPYVTTGKTIVLTRRAFVGKVRLFSPTENSTCGSQVGSPQTHGLLPEPRAPGPQVAGDTLRWELSELPRPLAPHLLFFPNFTDEFFKLLR